MMGLIELRSVTNSIIFLMLILYCSCRDEVQTRQLECILDSVDVDVSEMDIVVSQIDGWTDTTSLISIIYHSESINISIASDLKGRYRGSDIYFSHRNIDTLDKRTYKKIPNQISWEYFKPKEFDEEWIPPPYEPIVIRVEYDIKRGCIKGVIRGKGYVADDILSKCKCANW